MDRRTKINAGGPSQSGTMYQAELQYVVPRIQRVIGKRRTEGTTNML